MNVRNFFRDISKIIGKSDSWIVFYLKGKEAGFMRLDDKYGRTKKEILGDFEFRRERDKTYYIWYNHKHGYCGYHFDDYEIESY